MNLLELGIILEFISIIMSGYVSYKLISKYDGIKTGPLLYRLAKGIGLFVVFKSLINLGLVTTVSLSLIVLTSIF